MKQVVGRALSSAGAQVPLALVSFACALGLLVAVALDADRVGGPVALLLAALFLVNGLARLWLRHAGHTWSNR